MSGSALQVESWHSYGAHRGFSCLLAGGMGTWRHGDNLTRRFSFVWDPTNGLKRGGDQPSYHQRAGSGEGGKRGWL